MAALSGARSARSATAGATRLVDEVFSPTVLAGLERVRLRASHASGERPGHTRVRGRSDVSGTEIERHTPYAPGDDLRRIDWNSYARLGELLTRRFVAEREVPVWLLIDASGSMGPGEPGGKLDMAAAIAGIVATVSLAGGDRVYLGAVPGRGSAPARDGEPARPPEPRADLDRVGPLRSRRSLTALRSFLTGLTPAAGQADLAGALDSALRDIRRGLVFLISDFLVERAAIERALDVIGTRRCEGKIVQVLSHEDLETSWLRGRDTLVDRETGESFRIEASPDTLARYEAAIASHVEAVAAAAGSRAMMSALTVSDAGLRAFLRDDLRRLGLKLVR
ncbi:MAG TPA: DUF58 domain-containing protein [Candidatus Binatia bacterium]|nr:DUF58 domain-containing protein [Candidatus Binatia bacterium]